MSGGLVERLPTALAEADTPAEADVLRREVEAFIAIARKAPAKQIEVEWPALLRLRLDAWRRWGELLGQPEPGGNPKGQRTGDSDRQSDSEYKNRERARKLAFEVEDDAYFAYRARENADKLTLAGALRLVPDVVPPPPSLPVGSFRTVVADPPWQYGNSATRGAAEDHYPTMNIEELCALRVEERVAPDGHLYLWVTNNFLREAFEVLDAWGFAYKTCLTWVKPQMGMGNYFRGSTEHVLFGVRGRLRTNRRDVVNWFQAPRAKHSAKPDLFYDLVEQSSPGPYLELFARKARLGDWSYWGDEILADLEMAA